MECFHGKPAACSTTARDKLKDNYGRPFFTCSDRHDPCNFWQWGDIYESPRPRCKHGMVCTVRKVKKEGPTQNNLFYCCPQIDSCGVFEWKEIEPRLAKTGFVLFSDPLEYRYKNEDTGETFTSTNINAKEAYEEFLKKYE
ncbi:DNA topoisomerase [Paramuricea clavata]|uniref:DNA topoisomerase n=1 Tax=Paramuricea clavata TaxID=317549 RepID=A0A6S7HPI0_PARCT|nr:DNA topoisomerase [Paramuricea clavata]